MAASPDAEATGVHWRNAGWITIPMRGERGMSSRMPASRKPELNFLEGIDTEPAAPRDTSMGSVAPDMVPPPMVAAAVKRSGRPIKIYATEHDIVKMRAPRDRSPPIASNWVVRWEKTTVART